MVDVLRTNSFVAAVCFWVQMASTTASIFENDSGTIRPGATNTKAAIERAFTTGNTAFGMRGRVV